MSHLDEDVIAELALGDVSPEAHRLHVQSCGVCAQRLRELEATLASVRSLDSSSSLLTPPESVWRNIQAEIQTDAVPEGVDEVMLARARRSGSQRPWALAAAAAAGALIGGVAVGALVSEPNQGEPPLVAQTGLTDLRTEEPAGFASLHSLPDGTGVLVLDMAAEQVEGAALEVWLISSDFDGMISLGHLTEGNSSFVIPAGFDVSQFPIVDVSIEPFDGDPTHSGESMTRGTLES